MNLLFLILAASGLFFVFTPKSLQRKLTGHGANDGFRDIGDIIDRYGEPIDIIELNPTRGREVDGSLLVYEDFIVANGKSISKTDVVGITLNNANIPYMENSYQIVLTLSRGTDRYVHLGTGLDMGWTKQALLRVNEALKPKED